MSSPSFFWLSLCGIWIANTAWIVYLVCIKHSLYHKAFRWLDVIRCTQTCTYNGTRLILEMCYCHTLSLPVLQILVHTARSSDRCHRTYFILPLSSKGNSQNFHLGDRIRFCAEKHSLIMIYENVFRSWMLNILLT